MSFIKKIHVQMDRHVQMYMYMDMDILYHRMESPDLLRPSKIPVFRADNTFNRKPVRKHDNEAPIERYRH